MKKRIVLVLVCLFLCLFLIQNCKQENKNDQLVLRWVAAHPEETKSDVLVGLNWILSYLGAKKTILAKERLVWINETDFELDISKLGFEKTAIANWNIIIEKIKESESYKTKGWLDIGRFVVLTFNNSWHYYGLTGMPGKLDDFIKKYDFDDGDQFCLLPNESCVSKGQRQFQLAQANSMKNIAHMALEGVGEQPKEFIIEEFEVFDFMANGQPRFGVYDKSGNLSVGSASAFGTAGKPAKCMWCHESLPLENFNGVTDVNGYLSLDQHLEKIYAQRNLIIKNTITIDSLDVFYDRSSHYLSEVLYISFMEPSVFRLKNEWQLAEKEIISKLDTTMRHKHHEFKFLGDLFDRAQVDQYNPVKVIEVTGSARETVANEVNFLE